MSIFKRENLQIRHGRPSRCRTANRTMLFAATFHLLLCLAHLPIERAQAGEEQQSLAAAAAATAALDRARVMANDLQEAPAQQQQQLPPASSSQPQPQQPQPQAQPSPVRSKQPVINGNRATYVEPPADFKPIIYDSTDLSSAIGAASQFDAAIAASGAASTDVAGNNNNNNNMELGFDSPNQIGGSSQGSSSSFSYPFPSSSSSSSSSSQIMARPEAAMSDDLSGDGLASLPSTSGGENSAPSGPPHHPLKPSIERWSDWRDMSAEPDLASSDSAPSAVAAAPPQAAGYRNRYGAAGPSAAPAPTGGLPADGPAAFQAGHWPYWLQHHWRLRALPLLAGSMAGSADELAAGKPSFQIKGVQQQQQQSVKSPAEQATNPQQQAATKTGRPAGQTAHVKAGHHSPRRLRVQTVAPALNGVPQAAGGDERVEIRSRTASDASAATAPIGPTSGADASANVGGGGAVESQVRGGHSAPTTADKQSAYVWPRPAAAAARRRRKSKTNAEVRIQQLVAASQQRQKLVQQQQLTQPLAASKQVNGLAGAPWPPSASGAAGRSLQQQQPQLQPQQIQLEHPSMPMPMTMPVALIAGTPLLNRPTVLVRRFGAPVSAARLQQQRQQQPLPPANATHGAKRTLKRRRIKTLLPVGLTSWFLGGIRDLDGRHWRLPADVMQQLAINDVDLRHETPVEAVQPPQAGSVVLVATPPSSQPATPILVPAAAATSSGPHRQAVLPISQLVPR